MLGNVRVGIECCRKLGLRLHVWEIGLGLEERVRVKVGLGLGLGLTRVYITLNPTPTIISYNT